MRYLAKFVTIILLTTLSLVPAFAAVPCQQNSGCMACCSGALSPMMASAMSKGAEMHRGLAGIAAPNCINTPHSTLAVTNRRLTEVPGTFAGSNGISYVVSSSRTQEFRIACTSQNQRCGPRTQAVLSSFRI